VHDESIWYFAYGGNMARRVLARRGVAPLGTEAGQLSGYELRFSQPGLIFTEPAFGNLEPATGAVVHGALYRLTAADMERLDQVEGAEYHHVDVTVRGARSGAVSARAYLNPHPVPNLVPSRRYLGLLIEGAQELGLPESYVEALRRQRSHHIPVLSPLTAALVGSFERARRAGFRPERLRLAIRGRSGRSGRSSPSSGRGQGAAR
jgi:gamma-glutamylcyclotransferase (GGCT)/AIG2-like uncharacterized protein YtfP